MVTISSYHLTNIQGRGKCIQNYKSLEQSGEDIFENIIIIIIIILLMSNSVAITPLNVCMAINFLEKSILSCPIRL